MIKRYSPTFSWRVDTSDKSAVTFEDVGEYLLTYTPGER